MSRSMTRVSSRIAARCCASAGWTPSTIASRLPEITRQRRPQLVAHVGEQRLALALIDLEPLDHRVEAPHELPDRAQATLGDVDADRVVAVLDPPRRVDERVERPGTPPQPATQAR